MTLKEKIADKKHQIKTVAHEASDELIALFAMLINNGHIVTEIANYNKAIVTFTPLFKLPASEQPKDDPINSGWFESDGEKSELLDYYMLKQIAKITKPRLPKELKVKFKIPNPKKFKKESNLYQQFGIESKMRMLTCIVTV